jgi:hypothetical protein
MKLIKRILTYAIRVKTKFFIFNGSDHVEITEQEYNAKLQEGLNVLDAASKRRHDWLELQPNSSLLLSRSKPKRGFYDVYLCNTEGNT